MDLSSAPSSASTVLIRGMRSLTLLTERENTSTSTLQSMPTIITIPLAKSTMLTTAHSQMMKLLTLHGWLS